MSYTNETTYYGLPLPTGSDKSTFTDNNTAFQAVDAALHTAAEGAAQAAEDITGLTTRVGAAEDDIDALELDLGTEKGKISALQEKETLQDAAINDVRSDCEGMVSAYNEPTATSTHAYVAGDYFIYNDVLYQATDTIAIGDTIVPNTNCKTTTVADELDKVNSDLSKVSSNLGTITDAVNYDTTLSLAYGDNAMIMTTITVPKSGVYALNFFSRWDVDAGGTSTWLRNVVTLNGTDVSSAITQIFGTGYNERTRFVHLSANDVLNLYTQNWAGSDIKHELSELDIMLIKAD